MEPPYSRNLFVERENTLLFLVTLLVKYSATCYPKLPNKINPEKSGDGCGDELKSSRLTY